jgi:tetratricopeptide (TPR) repeat protein
MAFGFGFNKQKVLSAAEKFVQQGKLPSAITEYEKILKADPKDLTVMNTVGDLYARSGNNEKAVECFKSVGDAYASQGFTVKAIAMYKKLGKLKSSLESVLRLAELYTQQGLFNDARAQYLQVAEEFLRDGQLEQAVRIFQKTLEMDPENVAMRTRLAEVYIRLNKKKEAWDIFAAAAETLRNKGQLSAAEEILQRMLTLDPDNSQALLARGKNAFESGDLAGTTKYLEKVADLDSHPDGLKTLLQAYLETGKLTQAAGLAEKLLAVHGDVEAMLGYADALIAAGQFEDVLRVYQQHADRLLAASSDKVLENLHSMIGHIRENTVALEMLLELLHKAGDNTHLTEVYELLAHGYVQGGELEKARDFYLKLTQLEPENQLHAKNYQHILEKLGAPAQVHLITPEEGAVMVDELEATAPFIDQRYEDDVALSVRASLTDAELFISYNMPAKALGPLLSALPQAPRDLRINQKLAALYTRGARFTEAAVCCRTLESVYHDAGQPEEASRYAELAEKYEHRASAPAVVVAPPVSVQTPAADAVEAIEIPELQVAADLAELPVAAEPVVAEPEQASPASGLFFHAPSAPAVASPLEPAAPEVNHDVNIEPLATKEIDTSEEWEGAFLEEPASAPSQAEAVAEAPLQGAPAAADPQAVSEAIEEIRFYLSNGMKEEARAALGKLEELHPEPYVLDGARDEIDAAHSPVAAAEITEATPEEITIEPAETPITAEVDLPEVVVPEATTAEPIALSETPEPEAVPQPSPGVLDEFVSDLETSLGSDFLPQTTAHEVPLPEPTPAPEPETVEAAAAVPAAHGADNLNEFVSELEASLGDQFLPEAPVVPMEPQVRTELPGWPQAPPIHQPEPPPLRAAAAAASASPVTAPVVPEAEVPTGSPTFTYQHSKMRPLAGTPIPAPGAEPSAGIDLADMFGELKQELEEDASRAEEDPETHYNLGVAFREMGLLDEAIGELQKVCQSVEQGHPFSQIMQTYTWLSQCFLDKGVPEAAVRWYEKALGLPGLDGEAYTALHYELASAYELVGNKPAALQHFTEVYGSNIDYRDVAERIKSLKS